MKEIQLTQGKVALVDDDDFEWLSQWKWHTDKNGYAKRTDRSSAKRRTINMHREIMGFTSSDGKITDHINGIKTDNRKINLREATNSQNVCNQKNRSDNKSGFKGVCFDKKSKKWRSYIYLNGKQKNLGFYNSEFDAANEYKKAAIKHFGEFANAGNGCLLLKGLYVNS